jgi:hypothetical protein
LTILARYGTEDYPHAEEQIDALFARQLPHVARTVIVVDNALPKGVVETSPGRTLLGGVNEVFEFSAFDRALEHLGREIWSYDLVHFATSAFNTLYVAYLDRFNAGVLASLVGRPVCLGHIDCFNEPVAILGFRAQHWVRSCFFFMPPTEVRILGSFVSVADRARFFSGDPRSPFRADAPVDATYRRYVTDWLTGGDIGQGVEWHSSFALGPETLPTFQRKALSIFNEQMLALRLRASGCRLIDVTWLSAGLARSSFVAWQTPWWEQLAGRDRDAVRVVVSSDPRARDGTLTSSL